MLRVGGAARGNVAAMDDAALLVNTCTHKPFGVMLAESETVPQPFKFASTYLDGETSL